jgi:hypothetical protein
MMKNLSVSKIEKLQLCGLAMKYQYVDKIPQPASWKLLAGNVVHEILESALRHFARNGKYPPTKDLAEQFDPVWDARVREEQEKPWFIGWAEDKNDPVEKLKREYRPLVALAADQVLPTIKPWMIDGEPAVEYQVDLWLQSPWGPFQLLGYIDLLDASGVLMDWKTTDGPEVSARALRTWLQFAAYSILVWPIVGEEMVRCEKIFLVRGDRPFVQRAPFQVGPAHREWFARVAAQAWGMVKNNVYMPNTDGWYCKPDYCSFWAGCQGEPFGKKPVDPVAEKKGRMRELGPDLYSVLEMIGKKELVQDPALLARMSEVMSKVEKGS